MECRFLEAFCSLPILRHEFLSFPASGPRKRGTSQQLIFRMSGWQFSPTPPPPRNTLEIWRMDTWYQQNDLFVCVGIIFFVFYCIGPVSKKTTGLFWADSVMEKILVKAQTIYFPCQCEKLGYLLIECWF